ncbi:hypothetical protein HY415_00260 [Candidatus Kaiserbacteria bacterium]|nr:hypothetical protein [Candidatus Kaiserbacteria bacterium]
MKIFQLDRYGGKHRAGKYRELRGCGELRPFTEASLLTQILDVTGPTDVGGSEFLVFSKEEEDRVIALVNLVIGGLEVNQGLGHVRRGVELVLSPLLSPTGLYLKHIPADGDCNKPIAEVIDWLLAIGKTPRPRGSLQ